MTEYPVFVPYDGVHLATTLTVPDQDPSALVLLLAGTGAPRSHRFQLWTRTARELADVGIASARVDYRGIGDSGGRVVQPVLGDQRTDQAITVARFGLRACGVERLAVIGNCSGGVVGLGVAARMEECQSAVLIIPRLVRMNALGRAALDARKSKLWAAVRRSPVLRKLARRTVTGRRDVPSIPVAESFRPAVDHSRLLFVWSEHDRDPYVGKSRRLLRHMVTELPSAKRGRVEDTLITEGALAGFESAEIQESVIRTVVRWTVDALASPGERQAVRQAMGARAFRRR